MKKKIVFGITSLSLGGAERVLVDIANKLKEEYDITIFTLYGKGEFEQELNSKVHVTSIYPVSYKELSKLEKIKISLRLLLFGKKIYDTYIKEKYDVEIAFLEGPITRLFRFKNPKAKKIAWIHNDIEKVFGNGFLSKIKKKYDQKVYKLYQKLIFVSNDNLEKFQNQYTDISKEKMEVIYNYIEKENITSKSEEEIDFKLDEKILNVGVVARLTKQKGVDRLAKVHAKLKQDGYKENIYVIGEGTERSVLESTIKENKLEDSFILLGKKENPYPYMKKFDVIALLSYYEGYGMVLEEAKILNKKILITNTAAREAIQNTKNAKLIENSENGIYNGLKELILQKNDGRFEVVEEKYDNKSIIKQISEILK